jgi:WD40 repeat protein
MSRGVTCAAHQIPTLAYSSGEASSLRWIFRWRGPRRIALLARRQIPNNLAVTPDGRRAVCASDDGTLKVWQLASGRAQLAAKTRHVNVDLRSTTRVVAPVTEDVVALRTLSAKGHRHERSLLWPRC